MVDYNYKDRVKDTSTTTGTGNITLSGTAPTGFTNFNTAFGTSVTFIYVIQHQTLDEWEVGVGHLSASTTLVRDSITAGTNGTSAVNFSAGTKDVYCDITADQLNKIQTLAQVRKMVSLRL